MNTYGSEYEVSLDLAQIILTFDKDINNEVDDVDASAGNWNLSFLCCIYLFIC